eukprot:768121-Hanusia_phi.AAC.2
MRRRRAAAGLEVLSPCLVLFCSPLHQSVPLLFSPPVLLQVIVPRAVCQAHRSDGPATCRQPLLSRLSSCLRHHDICPSLPASASFNLVLGRCLNVPFTTKQLLPPLLPRILPLLLLPASHAADLACVKATSGVSRCKYLLEVLPSPRLGLMVQVRRSDRLAVQPLHTADNSGRQAKDRAQGSGKFNPRPLQAITCL